MPMIPAIRWDDYEMECTFTDENSLPVNLTGATIYFTVKTIAGLSVVWDAGAIIKKTITVHTNPTQWITTIELTNQDTNKPVGSYRYDIQMKTAWGKIRSIEKWVFSIIQDVTQDPVLTPTP